MGRALKIQKYGTAQGVTYPTPTTVNQPAAGVTVDAGYPNFGSLTDPVYNSAGTLSANDFLGVVGGAPVISSPSATYPEIQCNVNIALPSGTGQGATTGRIIRQKGAHKFLVANTGATRTGAQVVAGNTYQVASLGTTNWSLFTAGTSGDTLAVGDVFTATAVGSGNGTAYPVGVCVLADDTTPSAGYMAIQFSVGDSAAVYASYITNKWIRDWNGMTYGNYSSSNTGENIQSSKNFYPVNFFSDDGTVTWSGAEVINSATAQNGVLPLAQVRKITS